MLGKYIEYIINAIIIIFFFMSIFFTFKYRFLQFKSFSAFKKVILKEKSKSSYQTFMVSLASHIGTGNVVGITSALIIGGKGSLFWMWIFAVFASILSLMENTLGQIYKRNIDGENRGGSSYYISEGLGYKKIGILISVFLVLSNTIFFQPIQVNTISESIHYIINVPRIVILIGLIMLFVMTIFKGTKLVVRITEMIVPIMSISYILVGIVVIIYNIQSFPNVIISIIKDAFKKESIFGGAIFVGFRRSLFSHEAGLGTMPTISAMAESEKPINQGFLSCLGVFIDTIVICSITGFMILLYDVDLSLFNGIDLIMYIFTKIFNEFGKYLAGFFMILFAFATVVSQYYQGESNLLFISRRKIFKKIYKMLFVLGMIIGVFLSNDYIWFIIDIGMILLGIVNVVSLIKMRKKFENEISI